MSAPALTNPTPVAPPVQKPPRPRESTVRRLLRKTLIVSGIMLVLIFLTIQIVLWTNLPRRIVLTLMQDQLGLRVTAKSLSTGWLGHTSLQGVTVSLPLAEKPFLELPEMQVNHTWLPGLLLNAPMVVHELRLTGPKVVVRQSPSGRWNLQEALELATGALERDANNKKAADLPEVHVHDASLSLTDNHGRQLQIDPLQLDCRADSAVSWKFAVKAQDRVAIEGRVAPAAQWEHRLSISAHDLAAWAHPWAPQLPANTEAQLQWTGRVANGEITGNLHIDKLLAANMSATGQLAATYRQSAPPLLIEPKNLVLNTSQAYVGALQCLSGSITFDGQTIRTDSLDVAAFGGPINVKGWIDPANQIGELQAAWRQLALPGDITHDGSATIRLSRPFTSLLIVDSHINSTGRMPSGSWNAQLAVGAQGANWFNLDWHLDTPKLTWATPKVTKQLDGLAMRGQVRQGKADAAPRVSLDSVSIPTDAQLSGQGFYNLADQTWKLHVQGAHWPLRPVDDLDFAYVLDADGDARAAELHKLSLASGAMKLSASGVYRLGSPRPVKATISLDNPGEDEAAPANAVLRGELAGDAGLEGTLLPLQLSVSGRVSGTDVMYRKRPVGDLKLAFEGTIDAQKLDIHTQTLRFLGGDWDLHLTHSQASDESAADLKVHNLALGDVGELLGTPPMGGRLSGEWIITAPQPRLDLGQLTVAGGGEASGGVGFGAGLEADRIQFTTRFENGRFTLAPVALNRGDGRGNASITWNRADPLHVDASVSLSAWPIEVPEQEVTGRVWLNLNHLAVDLPDAANPDPQKRLARFNAPLIDIRTHLDHGDDALGDVRVLASSTDRLVDFKEVSGNLLGGTIAASGHFDLDQPQSSQANVKWNALDSRRFAILLPETDGLEGKMTGSLVLEAAQSPRDLAPMRFSVHNTWDAGSFRSLPLLDASINGFADFAIERQAGRERNLRIVLDDSKERRSIVHLGDGALGLWGRLTRHLDQSLALQAQVTFEQLNLDELLHVANPTANKTPGKVGGTLMVLFDTTNQPAHTQFMPGMNATADTAPDMAPATAPSTGPTSAPATTTATSGPSEPDAGTSTKFRTILDRVYCEGNAHLTEANLANIGVISFIYNALNVFQKANQATGDGTVDFRLERSTLSLAPLRYFNRGTEVRAQLAFDRVWAMPNCPVHGTAVGLARPLAGLKLPFLTDVETALNSLQSSLLTSVAVSGTVEKPVPAPLVFSQVGSDFRRFFHNDYNAANPRSEAQ